MRLGRDNYSQALGRKLSREADVAPGLARASILQLTPESTDKCPCQDAVYNWLGIGVRVLQCASFMRWSDPCPEDGSRESLRGGSTRQFGPDMTQEFLEKRLGETSAVQ